MNTKTTFIFITIATLFIYGCSKEKTPTPKVYANYSSLKAGNYWIYQRYNVAKNGTATATNIFDSCYVEKDTIIQNSKYYKIVKPSQFNKNEFEIFYEKDSLHYIVNLEGKILFSSEDFTNVLDSNYFVSEPNDTICLRILKMADKGLALSTPAGIFTTSNAKSTYNMYPNYVNNGEARIMNRYYTQNIGIVSETLIFFISSPNYTERRLVRYKVD